jgi:ABC-type oligopeptide transport system substrate-binding subunit
MEIGLDVQVVLLPLYANHFYRKSFFFRASWIADYPDAENYLSLFYSKNFSRMGQTIPILKMKNSIGYTTKLLRKLMTKNVLFCTRKWIKLLLMRQ